LVRAIIKKLIKLINLYIRFIFIYIHNYVYIYSKGLIGKTIFGRPCLILFTQGAKTGVERKNVLAYLKESNSFCIVASNGGREKNPGWYHNLKSNPKCEIQIGKKKFSGKAIQIDNEEYSEWWKKMDHMNDGGYTSYQKRTERKIPLMVITIT